MTTRTLKNNVGRAFLSKFFVFSFSAFARRRRVRPILKKLQAEVKTTPSPESSPIPPNNPNLQSFSRFRLRFLLLRRAPPRLILPNRPQPSVLRSFASFSKPLLRCDVRFVKLNSRTSRSFSPFVPSPIRLFSVFRPFPLVLLFLFFFPNDANLRFFAVRRALGLRVPLLVRSFSQRPPFRADFFRLRSAARAVERSAEPRRGFFLRI